MAWSHTKASARKSNKKSDGAKFDRHQKERKTKEEIATSGRGQPKEAGHPKLQERQWTGRHGRVRCALKVRNLLSVGPIFQMDGYQRYSSAPSPNQ
ncbi:hypothetical protein QE152_g24481 [Popillia japonica]|uniref:Uncharacterized protein n=1 Tax=Popillia japonica TaxID=7064 RepID=A0AAW1KFN0_POPJA